MQESTGVRFVSDHMYRYYCRYRSTLRPALADILIAQALTLRVAIRGSWPTRTIIDPASVWEASERMAERQAA